DEKVTVLEALRVVVLTPVAPVIAPALEILIDGVERKFVKPVEDANLIPLIVLELLFVAAGKFIPFKVFELLVFVAFVNAIFTPFTFTEEAPVLPLVKA